MAYDINNRAAYDYLKFIVAKLSNDYTSELLFKRLEQYKEQGGKGAKAYENLRVFFNKKVDLLISREFSEKEDYQKLYTELQNLVAAIPLKTRWWHELKDFPILQRFHLNLFKFLYENDGNLLEEINHKLISRSLSNNQTQSQHIQEKLKKEGIKKPRLFELNHPDNPFNALFSGVLGFFYNPLITTNKPYVAFTKKAGEQGPIVLRLGTQVKGFFNTLQPAFLNYLAVKNSAKNIDKKIHHIYFNLLRRNIKNQSMHGMFERIFEAFKTSALEKMNAMGLGVAVITLPADNHAFFEGFSNKKGSAIDFLKKYSIQGILSFLQNSIDNDQNDFYIPKELKAFIFPKGNSNQVIARLFDQSIRFTMGDNFDKNNAINAEQRQAIVFDFVKFGLTEHIIKQLNPSTINFTCKDAIDRGGVHTLWYEFRRRLIQNNPMTEQEFNMHLDASALLVKGRPVNEHRGLIFNVLMASFANNAVKYNHPNLQWVMGWLVNNNVRSMNDATSAPKTATAPMPLELDPPNKTLLLSLPVISGKPLNVTPESTEANSKTKIRHH